MLTGCSPAGPTPPSHLHVVAGVECLQVELAVGLGGPQAQVDGVVGAKARDGIVIGHGSHCLAGIPAEHLPATLIVHCSRATGCAQMQCIHPVSHCCNA